MVDVVFVAPYALPATVRHVQAMLGVADVRLALISTDRREAFGEQLSGGLAGHWRIDDCANVDQLTAAITMLGGAERVVTILENLIVPVAEARQRLGISGMDPSTAARFRDKALMKQAFAAAGVPCARAALVASAADVSAFVASTGLPVVVKPPAGAGARGTFRVDRAEHLDRWLATDPPSAAQPMVIEEFVTGQEHSFDSVMVDGTLRWYSVSRYHPAPLAVTATPWIQWAVILPRTADDPFFAGFAQIGERAVASLGLTTGLTHMEWFARPDGSVAVSEVGARPPGARFMDLMSVAHEVDMYHAWAALEAHGTFPIPQRRHAVGAAYLRAQGAGQRITGVTGLDRVSAATAELVVDVRLPHHGQTPASSYEGDGTVIVRHNDTARVEAALAEIVSNVRVELG